MIRLSHSDFLTESRELWFTPPPNLTYATQTCLLVMGCFPDSVEVKMRGARHGSAFLLRERGHPSSTHSTGGKTHLTFLILSRVTLCIRGPFRKVHGLMGECLPDEFSTRLG